MASSTTQLDVRQADSGFFSTLLPGGVDAVRIQVFFRNEQGPYYRLTPFCFQPALFYCVVYGRSRDPELRGSFWNGIALFLFRHIGPARNTGARCTAR